MEIRLLLSDIRRELGQAADAIREVAQPLAPRPGFRVWTDDYYNLLHILK